MGFIFSFVGNVGSIPALSMFVLIFRSNNMSHMRSYNNTEPYKFVYGFVNPC